VPFVACLSPTKPKGCLLWFFRFACLGFPSGLFVLVLVSFRFVCFGFGFFPVCLFWFWFLSGLHVLVSFRSVCFMAGAHGGRQAMRAENKERLVAGNISPPFPPFPRPFCFPQRPASHAFFGPIKKTKQQNKTTKQNPIDGRKKESHPV
jgi:hypothetical protein